MEWDRGGIKEGWLEGLGVEGVGGRRGVCFRMVLDFIERIGRRVGKEEEVGIGNKRRGEGIRRRVGKL